ncbi:MAG: glycosyltransferase family 39 protein [Deltaproteobacteria bacterium]|nr:glycosyltransferase family 39 protein [Deltaproteobacteria bacterium]
MNSAGDQGGSAGATRGAEAAALLALAVLFALLLRLTWHAWGDIVVDCGRDAYLALRLADGDVLYREVTSQYPPLAPYLNALLLRAFGVHLNVFYGSGMVSTVVITLLCYRLCRRALAVPAAAASAGLLLFSCGFGPFLYNYILPASYSGLYGLVSGLLTLLCLLRAWEQRGPRPLLLAGTFAGLAWLCKLESGLAATAACAAFCVARHGVRRAAWRELGAEVLRVVGPTAVVIAACALWLASDGVLAAAWFDNIFPVARMQYWNERFFHTRAPTGSVLATVFLEGAWSFATVSAALAVLGGLLLLARRRAARVLLVLALGLALRWEPLRQALAATGVTGLHWGPLLALGSVAWGLLQVRRPQAAPGVLLVLLLGAFTLGLSARWGFLVHEYSREYSTPTLILLSGIAIAGIAARLLPALALRLRRSAGAGVAAWTAAVFITLYGLAIRAQVLNLYALRTYPVRTARGEIYTQPRLGRVFSASLGRLQQLPDEAELFVIPEEGFLNFLSGRRSRVRYSTLIPGMLLGVAEEERFIAELAADGPEYLILSERRYTEFGVHGFATYNPVVARWLTRNYAAVDSFYEGGYGLQILRRGGRRLPALH